MPDETPTQGSEAADGVRLLASLIAPTGDEDIMALMLEVLNAAAREAREDLKQIMEQVRARTAAKRALRELINKVNRDVTANAHRDDCEEMIFADRGLGGEAAYHDVGFPVADVEAEGGVRFARVDLHKGAITASVR